MNALVSSKNGVAAFAESLVTGLPVSSTYVETHWVTNEDMSYSMQRTFLWLESLCFLYPSIGNQPPGARTSLLRFPSCTL